MAAAPRTDRRTAIADAAIEILSEAGSRGLTHRAVDRSLGLPAGSTGNYFPTRASLLGAAAERLISIDLEIAGPAPEPQSRLSVEAASELVSALMVRWLGAGARDRQIARLELLLEARRRQELGDIFSRARLRFQAAAEALLRAVGCPDPAAHAPAFTAFYDGLLIDQLLHDRTALDTAELARHIADHLRGLTAPSRSGARSRAFDRT